MTDRPILQVSNLTKEFGGFCAVSELSFDLPSGQILGLVGPNGAGKTTTFNMISGFHLPTRGRITYQGQDITKLPPHQRAKLGIVRTFQQTKVFNNLSVWDNIRIGFHLAETTHTRKHVDDVLKMTELQDVKQQQAGDLAYGDQRTLGIAIALGAQPQLLMLDEPFAGMNPSEATQCMNLIHRIRDVGTTILLVDHHMDTMVQHCDRLVVMHYGEKLAEGDPHEVTQDERVIEVYLGEGDLLEIPDQVLDAADSNTKDKA